VVGKSGGEERLLVASHGSDEALLLNTSNGKIIHRFDLSTFRRIPLAALHRSHDSDASAALSRSGMLPP